MCIRDSINYKEMNPGDARADASLAGCRMAQAWKETNSPYTCLLYTSDAADERSSVDLGGRRIIKKKKKAHNMGD